jgi:phosphoglycerol transferase MdoB-like AlkP superfamily enzyme
MSHPFRKTDHRLYQALSARFPRLAPCLHLILFYAGIVLLDLGFRWCCRFAQTVGLRNILRLMPFTFLWALLLTAVAALLPGMARRVYMALVGVLASVLCIVHGVYINMFRKFFSFSDMVFAGDGAAFADLSYLVIRRALLAWILLCLALLLLAAALSPRTASPRWLLGVSGMVLSVVLLLCARFFLLGSSQAVIWDQTGDPAFLYDDFSDSRACLTMLGIYQYTFRDLQRLLPRSTQLTDAEKEEIAAFAAARPHVDNDMTGLLEGKNLILVQLEAIDTWMVDYMPALQAVKEQSMVFANHYTPAYITAGTFNTEFMVNTGLLPAASGTSVSVYTQNAFPNALPQLFRAAGYTANSFHGSGPEVYNRGSIHENLGYEAYHSGEDMGMADHTLDSQLLSAYDAITAGDRFFSFIITYSGHGPYSEENPIFQRHAAAARQAAVRTDGNYVYAVGHAMETDEFVRLLMEKLEADGLLENTAVVFYADHYNYYMMNDALNMDIKGVDTLDLLQHTDFFIYSKDLPPRQVEKVTSSIDVLPTLANLYGLDAQYSYLTGDDAFSDGGGYVFFNDNTCYGGGGTEEVVERRKISSLLLASDFWRKTSHS